MSIESRSSQYGSVFGQWQIREMLGTGSGGKSAVFKLSRKGTDWDEFSALKVISLIEENGKFGEFSQYRREEYADALRSRRKKAEQEVHLMEQLRGYTNVVDYLDYCFEEWSDDSGFGCDLLIRMELLGGLRHEISRGRIYTESEIIRIGRDICNALVLCHSKNILHRDIKPENIFVNRDGNYKLGDFGIAKILDPNEDTSASTGIGTMPYAAPEQLAGRYDKRVDIYSLGLVLYELSNRNRLPFASSTYVNQQVIARRISGEVLPSPSGASDVLAEVILKACAPKAEDRYQTAEAFLEALNRAEAAQKNPQSETAPVQEENKPEDPEEKDTYQTKPAQTEFVRSVKPAQKAEAKKPAAKKAMKMPRKWQIAAGVLAAILALVVFFRPGGVIASGTCGDDIEWELRSSGHLIISGSGDMNKGVSEAPWLQYCDQIREIEIKEGVTGIDASAFKSCGSLTQVTIADGLERIGNHAFYACTELVEINLPDSLIYIGSYAFSECYSLTEIHIPDSVTYIQSGAFRNCDKLTDLYYGGSHNQWNSAVGKARVVEDSTKVHYYS